MPSSRAKPDARRKTFLNLSAQIEGKLRACYDAKFQAGEINQSALAARLGVDRAAINRRLLGHTNMTIETIADMVWGLGCAINVEIFDPRVSSNRNHFMSDEMPLPRLEAAVSVGTSAVTNVATTSSSVPWTFLPTQASAS